MRLRMKLELDKEPGEASPWRWVQIVLAVLGLLATVVFGVWALVQGSA